MPLISNALQRRLGDYLLAAAESTTEHLDKAIEIQCIYGGRLGTTFMSRANPTSWKSALMTCKSWQERPKWHLLC